jgi:putative glycosyltransferase (TIGR04372 family)
VLHDPAFRRLDRWVRVIGVNGFRLMLATPSNPQSYGVLLATVLRGLQLARDTGVPIYFLLPRRPVNSAIVAIECDDVAIVRQASWKTLGCRALWHLAGLIQERPRSVTDVPNWLKRLMSTVLRTPVKSLARERWLPKSTKASLKRALFYLDGQPGATRVSQPLRQRLRSAVLDTSLKWTRYVHRKTRRYKPLKAVSKQALAQLKDLRETPIQNVQRPIAAGEKPSKSSDSVPFFVREFGLDLHKSWSAPIVPVRLPPDLTEAAGDRAREVGITKSTRLVTLHVREAGFRPSLGLAERDKDLARDAEISSYLKAIDFLVNRGYTVVRVGDTTMKPFTRPGVIDLATHRSRTDLLELWCIMCSDFYIGCDSGAMIAPLITGTPRLLVNAKDPVLAYPSRENELYILKRVLDTVTGRMLSLREMLTNEFLAGKNDFERYHYYDNSAEEICEAVCEMLNVLSTVPAPSTSQLEYRRLVHMVIWNTIRANQTAGVDCESWVPDAEYLGHGWVARFFADSYLDATHTQWRDMSGSPLDRLATNNHATEVS